MGSEPSHPVPPVVPPLFSPLVLLALGLLLRAVPGREPEERWSWRLDGGLMLLALLAGGGLYLWLSAYHVRAGYSVSDFPEHCATMAAGIQGRWDDWTVNRSVLAGLPSVWAGRRVGVLDGLLAGAVFGAGLTAAALYLWARALHGRVAGIAAVVLGGAVAPVALLARTLSFYPTSTGLFCLSCALAAAAVRWRHSLWALAVGGVGVGLALLVDVRGLVWALALLPAVAGVALLDKPWRVPLRLLVVALPLWASFQLGPRAYVEGHVTLEVQANVVRMLQERDDPAAARFAGWAPTGGFVWGRSPVEGLPDTLRTLWWYREVAAARAGREQGENYRLATQVAPWGAVVSVAALLAAWTLRRRPLLVLAGLATVAPFVAAWQGAIGIQRAHLRFLSSSMPFVALLLGLALAALAVGPVLRPTPRRGGGPPVPRPGPARAGVVTLALLLLVLGVVPSWLSPVAPWRRTVLHEDGGVAELWGQVRSPRPQERFRTCVEQLRLDSEAGRPRWIRPVDGKGAPL